MNQYNKRIKIQTPNHTNCSLKIYEQGTATPDQKKKLKQTHRKQTDKKKVRKKK